MIAMVHLGALPGTPLYKEDEGLEGIVKNAHKDLTALQNAGVDAVMFGNENDGEPSMPSGNFEQMP